MILFVFSYLAIGGLYATKLFSDNPFPADFSLARKVRVTLILLAFYPFFIVPPLVNKK